MKRRHFIIGDVHGMFDALTTLVESFELNPYDVLIFVGDLVDKGPHSALVVRYVRELSNFYNVIVVEGNHEEKHRRFRKSGNTNMVGADEMATITDELSAKDIAFMETFVPFHYVPEHDVLVVHAGIPANMQEFPETVEQALSLKGAKRKQFQAIMRTRYVDADTGSMVVWGEEKEADPFWADVYDGRFGHVVFGHEPLEEVTRFPHATGVDTGAVYGRALSALVYTEGASEPFVMSVEVGDA